MFYWERMTESVCKIMEEMGEKRIVVGEALGMKLPSTFDNLRRFYTRDREEAGKDLHNWANGVDYPSEDKTLNKLGLANLTPGNIMVYLKQGLV